VNGPNQYSGRVEVFNGNDHHTYGTYQAFALQWGTICDSDWTEDDANVVCRSLGYRPISATPYMVGPNSGGMGPIWANNVTCVGTEFYAVDCQTESSYYNDGEIICDHATDDVGVTCLGTI